MSDPVSGMFADPESRPADRSTIADPKRRKHVAAASRPSRRALRQARSAQHLGDRRRRAEMTGPNATLAVAMDQLRSTIAQLPESRRPDAATQVTRTLDQLRQSLTEN